MREEVIRKARKRGERRRLYIVFSTKLARDAWHGRRDARIREKSDGPLIIPVTIDARSRVTGFMVGERRTKAVRKQASFDFAASQNCRHFGPRAVKKPCKWPNWGERDLSWNDRRRRMKRKRIGFVESWNDKEKLNIVNRLFLFCTSLLFRFYFFPIVIFFCNWLYS